MNWSIVGYMPDSGIELKTPCIYHYWIAPNGPCLCVKTSDVALCFFHPGGHLHITTAKSRVTCQECLELLHS